MLNLTLNQKHQNDIPEGYKLDAWLTEYRGTLNTSSLRKLARTITNVHIGFDTGTGFRSQITVSKTELFRSLKGVPTLKVIIVAKINNDTHLVTTDGKREWLPCFRLVRNVYVGLLPSNV